MSLNFLMGLKKGIVLHQRINVWLVTGCNNIFLNFYSLAR